MATAPPVRWAFSPLDEQLELRPKVAFTPRLEESMARLGTWMPYRRASREVAFFTAVQVCEATVRQVTEQAGAAQVRLQAEQVATIQAQCPQSPTGPPLQLMSVDGAYIQMVGGEWKEVKTLALGVVSKPVEERGEQVIHTTELSYFSRMSEANTFQQEALGEVHQRGVERAGQVCAVTDGADWIPKFVDYHRADAVRILDFAHAMEYVAQAGKAAHEQGAPCRPESPLEPAPLVQEQESPAVAESPPSPEEVAKRRKAIFERWVAKQAHELKAGEPNRVLGELKRLLGLMQQCRAEQAAQTVQKSLTYLSERRAMLAYAVFQAQGYPIGSGCVESANKLVVESRMKGAGMRWGPKHVNAMLAMRNLACNDRWEQTWPQIRKRWQSDAQAKRLQKRARRAQTAADAQPEGETAPPTSQPDVTQQTPAEGPATRRLATQQPPTLLVVSSSTPAEQATADLRPAVEQTSHEGLTAADHRWRPAPTHPWNRNFLRRRPA